MRECVQNAVLAGFGRYIGNFGKQRSGRGVAHGYGCVNRSQHGKVVVAVTDGKGISMEMPWWATMRAIPVALE